MTGETDRFAKQWVEIDSQSTSLNDGRGEDETENERQSQASQLVGYVQTRAELFHDENKEVYAQDCGTGEVRRVDGRQFRDWLVASFYKDAGKSARDQSVREALSTLSGLGRFDGQCLPVHVRVVRSVLPRSGYSRR